LDLTSEITFTDNGPPLDLSGLLPDGIAPSSLNIELNDGTIIALIKGSGFVPTKKSQVFSTSSDNQSSMPIEIYGSERTSTKDNNLLGKFELTGIRPAPRGVPQIEVTFEVDADGILKVAALEKGAGKENDIVLEIEQI
jgi:molecular chaperone DnaK (HSP70)